MFFFNQQPKEKSQGLKCRRVYVYNKKIQIGVQNNDVHNVDSSHRPLTFNAKSTSVFTSIAYFASLKMP